MPCRITRIYVARHRVCFSKTVSLCVIMLTLLVFVHTFAVWVCESRLGAPRSQKLRPGSVGRHQVSFLDHLFTIVGVIGLHCVTNQTSGTPLLL